MRYQSLPSSHLEENQETTKERALRQRLERRAELTYTASDYQRWAKNRNRVIAERQKEKAEAELAKSIAPPTIDPNNMYWPTHDFIKGEDVNVVLRRELESNHQQAILLTLDDAAQTLASMWDDSNRTDTLKFLDKIRGAGVNGVAIYKAYEMVKQFKDLGVVANIFESNGKEYIAIVTKNNSEKILRHVLVNGVRVKVNGHKYRIDNPKVMQLGLTPQSRSTAFKGSMAITFVISAAINTNDLIFKDDYHFVDWFGNVGVDIFKAFIAFGAGEVALLLLAMSPVGASVLLGAIVAIAVSYVIDELFNEWKVSEKVVTGLKEFNG
ncbi:Putative uncharacterized protein [Moritella viscosa]|uniref:hypothetical protein n=1 Tax=Moritella viscosa TaxID=80854 RepID=UPI00091E3DAE|nr:hypothetical protein [Moritella viscosa]SGZ10940.1 Putative uncharacterized protein [Moritella viscosa]